MDGVPRRMQPGFRMPYRNVPREGRRGRCGQRPPNRATATMFPLAGQPMETSA